MSISFNEKTKIFYLSGKELTYAFQINPFGYLEHLYFGKNIPYEDITYVKAFGANTNAAQVPGHMSGGTYNQFATEITFYGTGDYREPTVEIIDKNGDRLTELLYDSHEILAVKPKISGMPSLDGGETLVVHLKDKINGFACDLYYTVYDDASVIARRAVYKNGSDNDIKLNRAYSFAVTLPEQQYEAMCLPGAWASERHINRIDFSKGVFSVDSKRGSSSATMNPFLALISKGTTETSGEVFGANLVYSSSFVLKAEGTVEGRINMLGGINDFDFSWKLGAGEEFETPEVVLAYSCEGLGAMSRAFHDVYRNHLINKRFVDKKRPIVINNWEGTYFDFTGEKLKRIADGVKGTGIDTFVLDDGWFGKRDDDKSGLGDWVVNEKKLGEPLSSVIEYINGIGLKFGLWFEPEMINEDSDLFRAHPDYAIGAPNRARCYTRNQYMLDLTRKDVRDYIVASVNSILKTHNIEYVKWDHNRNLTEGFSFGRDAERQQEFAHRYALGVYDLCERIVEANPSIFFEGCSGGGGRFDPAMLYYFPQIWTSDNSDAEARTKIQYGTSMIYPLSTMSCHVSESPNHQEKRVTASNTRATIAHLGATGYELDASKFTDEDRARVKTEVEEYNSVSDLVLNGDLYRIDNPFDGNYFTVCVVSKDKSFAEMVAYRRVGEISRQIHKVKAAGLDENKIYYVPELKRNLSGATLMNAGWQPPYPAGDFGAVKYHFIEVK